jgi:hypothetical protein
MDMMFADFSITTEGEIIIHANFHKQQLDTMFAGV